MGGGRRVDVVVCHPLVGISGISSLIGMHVSYLRSLTLPVDFGEVEGSSTSEVHIDAIGMEQLFHCCLEGCSIIAGPAVNLRIG